MTTSRLPGGMRLPTGIRLRFASEQDGPLWSSVVMVHDLRDAAAPPTQPLPAATGVSRQKAEAAALEQFQLWSHKHWPRRTLPDPV